MDKRSGRMEHGGVACCEGSFRVGGRMGASVEDASEPSFSGFGVPIAHYQLFESSASLPFPCSHLSSKHFKEPEFIMEARKNLYCSALLSIAPKVLYSDRGPPLVLPSTHA
jgi:hypothetical protein